MPLWPFTYRAAPTTPGVGVSNLALNNYQVPVVDVAGWGGVPNRRQFQITAAAPNFGPISAVVTGVQQPTGVFFNTPQMELKGSDDGNR